MKLFGEKTVSLHILYKEKAIPTYDRTKKEQITKCMNKLALTMMMMWTTVFGNLYGQTYDSLWKRVKDAQDHDMPKTELEVLQKITEKAERENAYGHLLKAQLCASRTAGEISPDSLEPAILRIADKEKQATDDALRAVYDAVLGYIYAHNAELGENAGELSKDYYQKAMSQPEKLATVKATTYKPLVVEGSDSRYFGNDLLSLIAYETMQFEALHRYYMTTDNRVAQLFSALEMIRQKDQALTPKGTLERLDSLIERYGDLTEAGELAIERYEKMTEMPDITAEEKISFIDRSLKQWSQWKRMGVLRNARKTLTNRQFNAELPYEVFIPNREQVVMLKNLRGITGLTMHIYRAKVDGDTSFRGNLWEKGKYNKLKPLLTALPEMTQTRQFGPREEYEVFEDSITLPGLPVGVYLVEIETTPGTEVSRQLYFVSDVRVVLQHLPEGKQRIVVLNATTGQPIKGASVRLSHQSAGNRQERKVVTVTTDARGEHIYDCGRDYSMAVFAYTDTDRACPEERPWGSFSYREAQAVQEHGVVYTDRSIYRPGQTVHVSAIIYQVSAGWQHQAIEGKELTVSLRDANWQEIGQKTVKTDRFGTCTTDFVLPTSGLTGDYSIRVGNGYTGYFRVEEYKRPTFQVEFQKVDRDYADGDTVAAQATVRSYAGVPVQGARVMYKVVRRRAFWWASYSRYWMGGLIGKASDEEEVSSGETMTADDGTFKVDMPLKLPVTRYPMFYHFVVTADVTDQAGETHQGQLSLPLGNRKTALTTTLPAKIQAEAMPAIMFNLRNAAGNDIGTEVRYQIDGGKWVTVKTNTPATLPKLKSGKHKIIASSLLSETADEAPLEQEFIVFSENDKRPATETDDWFWQSSNQFPMDGKPVTVQVGASDRDLHIVYSILSGNKVIESGATDRSGELINRKFTYQESYGNGLLLTYAWIKNGKVHEHTAKITRPLPDKQLKLQWTTFRDRLTPGQQEEWTLSITKTDGTPADAQLMATLYDKSLDQIRNHKWQLKPETRLPLPNTSWIFASWGTLYWNGSMRQDYANVNDLQFNTFDHDCYPVSWRIGRRTMRTMRVRGMANKQVMFKEVSVQAPALAMADLESADSKSLTGRIAGLNLQTDEAEESGAGAAEEEAQEQIQLRENLQETAFFYPQLAADSEGNVQLKFTLPESLTTWRLLGVGHTTDMMYGTIEAEAVAQKDVMIQPNMPRFLRMGDKATLSARIFNTCDQARSGCVRLQFIDPDTEKVLFEDQQEVSIEPNGTASPMFHIDSSVFNSSLLVCKWTVSGEAFSDGEQHYLPILPDTERVTVTVPFTQNEPGVKSIDLSTILPTADTQLTIEYTNNPAWLMVQALPTVGQPCDDNAISLATSLYANLLGRHFMEQNPNVKTVFEQWKQEDSSLSTLHSSLQKNQELKDLLLNETPWMMEANRESEQKQMLGSFFDQNTMQQRVSSATEKLGKLQRADGSWSWWEGMPGSTFMTISISEMLVRLNQMAGQQEETKPMLDSAFGFMGKEMVKMVHEMKKQEKRGVRQTFPSHIALEWLYICTLDGRELPADVQQANAYLKNLLRKDIKNQTIYEKAISAIVLDDRNYVKSLKEWTVYKEETGRYYDTPRASYSWRNYRIPTQVAAIEALQRLTPADHQTIEEMQRWLLQEKRTQSWETPLCSVDAIYAFFSGDEHNRFHLSTLPSTLLKLDGQPIETSKATAGIGYVKTTMPANGVKTFTAEKTSEGTSWGAVYAQFMQPASEITDQQSGISVKREILHSPLSDPHSSLKVGDRIKTRITIVADRDYDFVQIVDKRAACMEPVQQLSGYRGGYYCSPKDHATNYYFDMMPKGKHVIETEYYIDREGQYETGACTAQCAYSPEFRGTTKSITINVTPKE